MTETLVDQLQTNGLSLLNDKHVVLLGAGMETLSVIPHLREAHVRSITMVESAPLTKEQSQALSGITVVSDTPGAADVVLRSPGVRAHQENVALLCAHARIATTPTGLWLAIRGPKRTIVVTGTKGKSSTATLIAAGLSDCGIPTTLVGNIGISAWGVDPHRDGVVIAELSSYHGADLLSTGEVGVLTLLADDHLDWHGSAEAYRQDKLHIFSASQNDRQLMVAFTTSEQVLDTAIASLFTRIDAPGDFQSRNVALAVAAVRAELALFGAESIPDERDLIAQLDNAYPQLPSRFEAVESSGQITWIDDALASNPSATAAALERLRTKNVVLIAGGHDRGVSLRPVLDELANWPEGQLQLVWIGTADDHRFVALAELDAIRDSKCVDDVAQAVVQANALVSVPKTTVLFSPLAPTDRVIGVWSDRSHAFRKAISSLDASRPID